MMSNSGTYLTKTSTGYYKTSYMVLTNHELYLYSSRRDEAYSKMICLTPGVFVVQLSNIKVDPIQVNSSQKDKSTKGALTLYPIELHVGGTVSNIGQTAPVLSGGDHGGTITLYFDHHDNQKGWVRFLERATGNFSIKDEYIIYDKHKENLAVE